jgi:hypothetical protein
MPSMIIKHTRCAVLVASAVASMLSVPAQASSHREAPFITQMPKVDGTDFYMFQSYEPGRAGFTTLIADYVPLQDAYGGPNYFEMDPEALYEIHIDNVGDAKEHLTYQFRFTNKNKDTQLPIGPNKTLVSIPLVINGGAINTTNAPGANVRETYQITQVTGDRRSGQRDVVKKTNGESVFDKPLDNIGNKSIPDYAAYAAKHVYDIAIPGCATPGRVFVGQRKDPFVVNLGETFDLINIQYPATQLLTTGDAEKAGHDDLQYKNITSIEMEVPTKCLLNPNGKDAVIGGWTTASVRQGRLMNPTPSTSKASKEGGAWTQVSRLGMPLVNELVIGLKDKDQFNHSKPMNDGGQFLNYVATPTLPALIEILFGPTVKAPTNFPRKDLIATFLTGIPTLNQQTFANGDGKGTGDGAASEMLRLNTGITPVAATAQKRLGVIGGDAAGFPNGRRPGDDVVDIELRVAMGKLCVLPVGPSVGCGSGDAPAGAFDFTDGAFLDSSFFDGAFPYLKTPLPGSVKH